MLSKDYTQINPLGRDVRMPDTKAGTIKGFTGIDDPYVPPSNPEITTDTRELNPMEAAQKVLLHLEEQGYIR